MKTLLLITGPTCVGKTELSLRAAEHYGSPVISCDSRQIFRELPIGTAAPTPEEQSRVRHYFVGTRSIEENYSAGQYERDATELLENLFASHEVLVMTGGSMLYAEAVCKGLDDLPSIPPEVRIAVQKNKEGRTSDEWLEWLQSEVRRLDPAYWEIVDRRNPARLIHCVELCIASGRPYSELRTSRRKERPYRIVKVGLDRPREELYARINQRVGQMIESGLESEARAVYPRRELPSLQTVGYREMFDYFDGKYDLSRAVELIRQNTRHYAKRQLTWFRRDGDIQWLKAQNEYEKNISNIDSLLGAGCLQTRNG